MKIALVSSSISGQAAGIGVVVSAYARLFIKAGHQVRVFTLEDRALLENPPEDIAFSAFKIRGPSFFGYAPLMVDEIVKFRPDVIHVHGIWMYPVIAARHAANRLHARLLISPNGMLDGFAVQYHRWKKVLAEILYERKNFNRADVVHANTVSEMEFIRKFKYRGPVAIINNGVELPPEGLLRHETEQQRTLLYLGRVHVKKGLDLVVEALGKILPEHPELLKKWHLNIVGWGDPVFQENLEKRIRELSIGAFITFCGACQGDQKFSYYRDSHAFLLPSRSEGVPMAVLESAAYGLPLVISPDCHLQEFYDAQAAIRVEPTVESVQRGLLELFSGDQTKLNVMGQNAYKLCTQKFCWESVGRQMLNVYQWLSDGQKPPDCIVFEEEKK